MRIYKILLPNFPTFKVSTDQYAIFWHTNLQLNPTQVPYTQHVKSQTTLLPANR